MTRARNRMDDNGLLCMIPQITLDEYAHQLQHYCETSSNYGPMFFMLTLATIGYHLSTGACTK